MPIGVLTVTGASRALRRESKLLVFNQAQLGKSSGNGAEADSHLVGRRTCQNMTMVDNEGIGKCCHL